MIDSYLSDGSFVRVALTTCPTLLSKNSLKVSSVTRFGKWLTYTVLPSFLLSSSEWAGDCLLSLEPLLKLSQKLTFCRHPYSSCLARNLQILILMNRCLSSPSLDCHHFWPYRRLTCEYFVNWERGLNWIITWMLGRVVSGRHSSCAFFKFNKVPTSGYKRLLTNLLLITLWF